MTSSALLDAAATFPCLIEVVAQKQLPTLTYLRIFRLFRILKTERYFHACECVWRIVWFNREILLGRHPNQTRTTVLPRGATPRPPFRL